jgi:hypothetical protein
MFSHYRNDIKILRTLVEVLKRLKRLRVVSHLEQTERALADSACSANEVNSASMADSQAQAIDNGPRRAII